MLKIGTSGFSFEDWKGRVYPKDIDKSEMLSYYENEIGFNAVEINYTYYQMPSKRTMTGLDKKTSKDFGFVVKCNKAMTHEIWDEKKKIRDNSDLFKSFTEGILPLIDSGKLGCILAQFPVFFYPKPENLDYILACKERLSPIPLVIEFRNKAWVKEATFGFLKGNRLGFTCVDEPRLPRLMPDVTAVTSDIGYFRLHGRNKNWFNASREERYDYRYSDDELKSFIPKIKMLQKSTKKTYLFFNNCHAGSAAINAKRIKDFL